jgi:hypothetical protein
MQNPAYQALGPTFCIPKTASCGRDCCLRFRSSSGATFGGLDTRCRGDSKSLANLPRAYAAPDDARARTVRRTSVDQASQDARDGTP